MTGEEVEKYIKEDLGYEPRHDVDAISDAASELAYLYRKYNMDMEVIENGGHPEIGYENTLPIKSLSDEAFNTLYRAKRRRSQCKSK